MANNVDPDETAHYEVKLTISLESALFAKQKKNVLACMTVRVKQNYDLGNSAETKSQGQCLLDSPAKKINTNKQREKTTWCTPPPTK